MDCASCGPGPLLAGADALAVGVEAGRSVCGNGTESVTRLGLLVAFAVGRVSFNWCDLNAENPSEADVESEWSLRECDMTELSLVRPAVLLLLQLCPQLSWDDDDMEEDDAAAILMPP